MPDKGPDTKKPSAWPTPALLEEFREKLLSGSLEEFDPRDVERIRESNSLCRRYLRHKRSNLEEALHFAKDSLKWRKEFAVNDISLESLPRGIFEANVLFPYNTDKLGAHVLMIRSRYHHKQQKEVLYYKKFIVYLVEKLLFEKHAKCITVVFDCSNAGIANMDMDMTKFVVNLFRDHYPACLGYVIVHEMPWIFSTVWNIIKAMLPAEGVSRIKFTKGAGIKEFIDEENLPVYLGGKCDYVYKYVEGKYLGERCPMGSCDSPELIRTPSPSA